MKRSAPIVRTTPLARSSRLERSAQLRQIGARAEREADELADFRLAVLARADGVCERCGCARACHAHHIVGRGRAPGWEHLHDAAINGAALCRGDDGCHALVHRHAVADWPRWVKTRAQVERELAARASIKNTVGAEPLPNAAASPATPA